MPYTLSQYLWQRMKNGANIVAAKPFAPEKSHKYSHQTI